MPTKLPRVNVVLDRETREALTALAAHRDATLSAVAADLIREALEDSEDRYWSELADRRLQETSTWLSSEEFWKAAKKKVRK